MTTSSRFLTMASRLNLLRMKMLEHNLSAYVVVSSDVHDSEYVADCDKRREFITGFTGSYGTAVITRGDAYLFTDSRYYTQADKELESSIWKLIRQDQSGLPTITDWFKTIFNPQKSGNTDPAASSQTDSSGSPEDCAVRVNGAGCSHDNGKLLIVGIDCGIISNSLFKTWQKKLAEFDVVLFGMDNNLVDEIWLDRPSRTDNPLSILPPTFTGVFWSTKILRIFDIMKEHRAELLIITALDEVAYLLNLRGSDIPYCPVFFSYLIITLDGVHIFMDDHKLRGTPGIVDHLTSPRVKTFLHSYMDIYEELKKLSATCSGRIWMPTLSSQRLENCLSANAAQIYSEPSPVPLMKMCKTSEEVSGMRRAHINDSIALCRFFYLMSEAMEYGRVEGILSLASVRAHLAKLQQQDNLVACTKSGGLTNNGNQLMFTMTECLAADILENLRSQESEFVSLSFETISASGPNAAIVHYTPKPSHDRPLSKRELYLVDSGGQYSTGTTDVTRTVHFGTPTEEERLHFTLVLKGNLSLQNTIFPAGTMGSSLDAIAREPLWTYGLKYGHGTGHGVGAFLNVHEGPCRISPSSRPSIVPEAGLRLNTIITIEPGYYKEDCFGIRIENVNLIVRAGDKLRNISKFSAPRHGEELNSPGVCADKATANSGTGKSSEPAECTAGGGAHLTSSLIHPDDTGFLTFEPLTLVPIQRKMILSSVMSARDIAGLNAYHERCRRVLIPVLMQRNLHDVVHWLNYETQAL